MHGNVWEWCLDWYTDNLGYAPVTDPKGLASGSEKVLRSGSYVNDARECRSAYRAYTTPYTSMYRTGFRLALTVEQEN